MKLNEILVLKIIGFFDDIPAFFNFNNFYLNSKTPKIFFSYKLVSNYFFNLLVYLYGHKLDHNLNSLANL